MDFPERYGLNRARLPYPTGIIAVSVFLTIFWYTVPWTMQSVGIVSATVLLAAVSVLDDRHHLPAWLRLVVQAMVALLVFATGSQIYTITNPLLADGLINLDTVDIVIPMQNFPLSAFHFPLVLPLWSGVFTVFWLMLTMNALNWFDGIPGQVSTLSTIAFAVIGFLSLSDRVDQPELAIMAFSLAAIALGCLAFDFPPNKVLMGDTGAMFFGFALGLITIYSGGKVATAFLCLGVPLIDVFIVVVRRLARGKNPMRGNADNEHLHHRLLKKDWSERKIIALTASLGTLFGLVALFISTTEKMIAGVVLFVVMLGLSRYSKT